MRFFVRFMALYLLLGSLIPRMDYSQLTRLPALVAHYQCHVASGEKSLAGFLAEHFIDGDSHQHPERSGAHDQLPFHSFQTGMDLICWHNHFPGLPEGDILSGKAFFEKNEIAHTCLKGLFRPPCA